MVPAFSEFLAKAKNLVSLYLYLTPFKSLGPFLSNLSIDTIAESLSQLPILSGEFADKLQEFMSTLSLQLNYA
jgi:hypothetical protein